MNDLNRALESGRLDESLSRLYGQERLEGARDRVRGVLVGYERTFGAAAARLFSAPGRTEIGGNHTDHQHGRVLAGAVDLDLLAAVSPTGDRVVRLQSEGYPYLELDLSDLTARAAERNTTAALIRGVAARMGELGCPLSTAGLNIYMVSDVPGGSGLSSSAAFEVLMGTVFNTLYWNGKATAVEIAQIGQYAENVFFGKPCGLMDQTASSVGGVVSIDFKLPREPKVEKLELDLGAHGYALCILDSHASHADLTGEYAAITGELAAVSALFGQKVLRDIPEEVFYRDLARVREAVGDRAALRAIHVYADDHRAYWEAEALRTGDFEGFLSLVRASGHSSAECLQNVTPAGAVKNQALMLTIALAQRLLGERGAARVHGGGFGGTAQAFVPLDLLDRFRGGIDAVLGPGSCHVLSLRPVGGVQIA